MRVALVRTLRFRALHRFFDPDRTHAENLAAFGALAELPGHAHDYEVSVSVTGPYDATRGTLLDLGALDRVLDEEVTQPLAGKNLSADVPHFAAGRPIATCEALARWLFGNIAARLPAGLVLERVRVAEDWSLSAECTAEGVPGA